MQAQLAKCTVKLPFWIRTRCHLWQPLGLIQLFVMWATTWNPCQLCSSQRLLIAASPWKWYCRTDLACCKLVTAKSSWLSFIWNPCHLTLLDFSRKLSVASQKGHISYAHGDNCQLLWESQRQFSTRLEAADETSWLLALRKRLIQNSLKTFLKLVLVCLSCMCNVISRKFV